MSKAPKYECILAYTLVAIFRPLSMHWATAVYVYYLRYWGGKLTGCPVYITGNVDVDGMDVIPGACIERGCIDGVGTVGRGFIPDFSIVIGSPGQIVGDTRDYMTKQFSEHTDTILQSRNIESNV